MTSTARRSIPLISLFLLFPLLFWAAPSQAGPPGDNGAIIYSDGEDLYAVLADGTNRTPLKEGGFLGFDVAPDGLSAVGVLVESGEFTGPVVILDLFGAVTPVSEMDANSAAFSNDGTRVAFATENGLYLHVLGETGAEVIDPEINAVWDWSPVDDRVLVTRSIPHDFPDFPEVSLETIDVDTDATVVIEDNGPGLFTWYPVGGDFSPDGTDIVYTANTPGVSEVLIVGDADPIAATDAQGGPTGPVTWSPDGTKIAFARSTVSGEEIVVHDVASGGQTSFAADALAIDWAPVPTEPPPPDDTEFDDVPDDHLFHADIVWLAERGITRGCNPPDNTNFCPDDNVTRGQMAAFLVRAFGYSDNGGGDLFDDDNGHVFEADIDRLATAGVTRGCNPPDNTNFCPDDNVTRGQMAAFLVRAFGYSDNGGGDLFDDDNGHVFEADIDRLATAGVTRGCNPPDNTNFCPDDNVTRGQMAAFLHRAFGD